MRGATSLVYFALLRRAALGMATSGAASGALLCASIARADATTASASMVRDVRVRATDGIPDGAEIEIVGTTALTYSARVAEGGRHIVIDLGGTDVAGAPTAITTPIGVVGGVLTQSFDVNGARMTRLTVSLQRAAVYRVVPDGATLRVIVTPTVAKGAPAQGAAAVPAAAIAVAPAAAEATASVRDVRFERVASSARDCAPNGCDRVVVELDRVPAYSLKTTPGGRPRLELRATKLPEPLARTLDVLAYDGALRSVAAAYDIASGSTTIDLDRTSDVPGIVVVEGSTLTWSFPLTKSAPPSPISRVPRVPVHVDGRAVGTDGGPVRRVVTVAREEPLKDLPRIETSIHDEDPKVETAGGGAAGFASASQGAAGLGMSPADVLAQQRYTGRTSRTRTFTTCCASWPTRGTSTSSRATTWAARSRSACATCRGIRCSTSCSRPRAWAWSVRETSSAWRRWRSCRRNVS
jgi:hypothetical protein